MLPSGEAGIDRPHRVLVTGAGGKTGRAVIAAVRERGVVVRGVVRDREAHRDLAASRVELVVADQRDPAALTTALDGCDAVYAVAPNMSADEISMGRAVITAATRAGVERLCFHSVVHPQLSAMPHHADKGRVEEQIIESGLAWTILQPNAYLQNLVGYREQLRAGRYPVPYATDRPSAMVDLREVAEVAARCLLDGLGVHASFELSGPAGVTPDAIAATAAHRLGIEVVASRQDPDDWAADNQQLPTHVRERLHAMFAHYDRHGSPGDATVLRCLLGREPRGLGEVLDEVLAG